MLLERAAAEQPNKFYTAAAELRATKMPAKKCLKKTKETWHLVSYEYELLLFLQQLQNILGYSARNQNFKRLEPRFQSSATRSASKEGTETAAALPHSRECTKEPISASPNNAQLEKFGSTEESWNILTEQIRWRGASSCRFDRRFGIFFVGNATQVVYDKSHDDNDCSTNVAIKT